MAKLAYRLAVLLLFVYLTVRNVDNPFGFVWALASAAWAYDTYRRM